MAWKNQFSSLYPAYSGNSDCLIIIAKDSEAVESWLEFTNEAEENPEEVLADIESGAYNDIGVQYVIVAFAAYLFTPLVAVLIEKIPVVRYLILGISIE